MLGVPNYNEVEAIMEAELNLQHHDDNAISEAVLGIAAVMPALGVVAAILGVIISMGSFSYGKYLKTFFVYRS